MFVRSVIRRATPKYGAVNVLVGLQRVLAASPSALVDRRRRMIENAASQVLCDALGNGSLSNQPKECCVAQGVMRKSVCEMLWRARRRWLHDPERIVARL